MKEYLHIYGLGLLLLIGAFVLTYQFVQPSPPRTITIATGSESGAYYAFAQQYRAILEKEGINLEVVNTSGSIDNIERLQRGEVDIAFVQSGTGQSYFSQDYIGENDPVAVTHADQQLTSLASVYYEPLWLFMSAAESAFNVTDLLSKRIAIGEPGSGTHALARLLLKNNGIDDSNSRLLEIDSDSAAQQLRAGQLDFVFVVSSLNAPLVQALLADTTVVPFDFNRSEAYIRRYRFLSEVTLPQGVVDFSNNIPEQDIRLLSAAATLVTHDDLHPALVALLMQAIDSVHSAGDILEAPRAFPSRNYIDFPLDKSAQRHFEHGPPFLQRYLPFWAAVLVDQLKVFLIPIIALMIPLMRILPPLYRWRVRSRIYRWYRDLREIEQRLATDDLAAESLQSLKIELNLLQQDVTQQAAPLSYTDELYHLRTHIKLVKERLDNR